ncbi:hypothetical protein Golob_011689 [Gossypium lobatum]|uniref:RNase H type-1 domain-containing protein n=1 Tax=Gossypium lobatum TaxID=34289 RepID=A0A7J8MQJ3_9ROSI|nr:hypothetical protein [Gossypium lobatum]
MNTLPKICVFTWRVGHELLPTNAKIASIRQGFRQDCPRCGVDKETLIHALKDYSTARAILSIGGLDNKLLIKDYYCCIDWMEDVMRILDKKATADFVTTLWNSWNNRNKFIFRGKEDDAHDSFTIGDGGGFKDEVVTAEWAELYAFEESLKIACSFNITTVVFETESASLVEIHKAMEKFKSISICWANRCCNKVADFICKKLTADSCNWSFDMDYPLEIHELVISDKI